MAKLVPKAGYLLLFDIRDSTARKEHFRKTWPKHVVTLNRQAAGLGKRLAADVGGKVFTKSIGDAVMVFVECGINPKNSETVLLGMAEFRNRVEDMPTLEGLRLKCVGSLIAGDILGNGGDVLGRPVDFAFRMEQFADVTHMVINEPFHASLGSPEQLGGFRFKVTSKIVKGWKEPEPIVLVVEIDTLLDTVRDMTPEATANHVLLELFQLHAEGLKETKSE
ncbi:MAG: hypothetical protein KJZ92_13945 [Rhodocyclaceae bacterium]|nr:hypothetical protein [Rhodocyclaceae bacterium]